jgi:hypothetical protein
VRPFEEALHRHLDGPGRPVARRLLEVKAIDEEMKAELKKMLDAFLSDFQARTAAA